MADETKPTTTPPPTTAEPKIPPRSAGASTAESFASRASASGTTQFGGARAKISEGIGAKVQKPAGSASTTASGAFVNSAKQTGQAQQKETSGTAELIMSIPVEVQVVLGGTTMPVATLMDLGRGAVITLDKQIGDPVDIVVNGRVIARGEVIVMEDDSSRFGVSLTEIIGS